MATDVAESCQEPPWPWLIESRGFQPSKPHALRKMQLRRCWVFVDCGLWCFHLSRCSMAQHFSNRHATGFARSEVIPLKISLRGCSARHTGADECITPCLQYCASRSRNQLRIKEILGPLSHSWKNSKGKFIAPLYLMNVKNNSNRITVNWFHSSSELWLKLCWCDSGWWWYQLNTNWCQ